LRFDSFDDAFIDSHYKWFEEERSGNDVYKNSRDLVPTRNLPVGPEDSPTTLSTAGLWSGDWQVKTSRMR
jgi:hypothetical protein